MDSASVEEKPRDQALGKNKVVFIEKRHSVQIDSKVWMWTGGGGGCPFS
jgi:hypothetical protein